MDPSRFVLTDRQWQLIAPHCLGRDDTRGSTGRDNRLFLETVLWIVRTDAPGAICPRGLATGTAPSDVFVVGFKLMYSNGYLMPSAKNLTWNTR